MDPVSDRGRSNGMMEPNATGYNYDIQTTMEELYQSRSVTNGMDEEIKKRLDAQDELLEKIYTSSEKTRKYFLWTLIITLTLFVLPLVGLLFAIPKFLSIYTSGLGGL